MSDAVTDSMDAQFMEGARVRIVHPGHPNEGRLGVLTMKRAPLLSGANQKHCSVRLDDGQRIIITDLAWLELACYAATGFRAKLYEQALSSTAEDFVPTRVQLSKLERREGRAARPVKRPSTELVPGRRISGGTNESQLPDIVRTAASQLLPRSFAFARSQSQPLLTRGLR